MTDREKDIKGKLVELLEVDLSGSDGYEKELIADYLIANGVTFATDTNVGGKWIPVTEQLPEIGKTVMVCGSRGGVYTAYLERDGRYQQWHKLNSKSHYCNPTHWMPLPEPPKEE